MIQNTGEKIRLPVNLPLYESLPELDLYMDQVISLIERYFSGTSDGDAKILTPAMVNNYVKMNAIPAPVKKRYTKDHLIYLLVICTLKQVMPISAIRELLDCESERLGIAQFYRVFREDFMSHLQDNFDRSCEFIEKEAPTMSFYAPLLIKIAVNAGTELLLAQELFNRAANSRKKSRDEAENSGKS